MYGLTDIYMLLRYHNDVIEFGNDRNFYDALDNLNNEINLT
jgi:hypothetical protein